MRIRVHRNLFLILIMDIILLLCSISISHLIRFDFDIDQLVWQNFIAILPYLVCVKLICFYHFDLYKGMWRYTSLIDLMNIVKAATISSLCIIVLVLFVNRFENISRSVFIIDWCLTIIFIVALRVFTRLCFAQFTENVGVKEIKDAILQLFRFNQKKEKGVLIIGAGDCGEMICREFRENASIESNVIGFLDDDPAKIGRKIHGISVIGEIDNLEKIVESTGAEQAIIALPSATAERMRQIVNLCKAAEISSKTIPDMGELIDGKINVSAIRNVEYRDLLGRKPVRLDWQEIGKNLGDKHILVTGAGGSIGTGLCQQICRFTPQTLILFERAESPLYEIDLELRKIFPKVDIIPILGDIQDIDELYKVFDRYRPDIVFHAAAYKHVPMLEEHPWKAVENNIVGTENLVQVADHFKCSKFVFISTDKAVNPTNVMGATKRVSEMIVQNRNTRDNSETTYVTVRFGNVIGSAGSVIPLFKKQIKEGGPVTVTHPEITRFFMLVSEACQLILQAASMGRGGEIFILEMGEPVKIVNMAKDLIRFFGFEPDVDIKVEYTGLRPGEKLYEELMTDDENVVPTDHKKIHVFGCCKIDMHELEGKLKRLKQNAKERDGAAIVKNLQEIVPEFSPQNSVSENCKN